MCRGSNPHRGESFALTCRIVGTCLGSMGCMHWPCMPGVFVVILSPPRWIGEDPICLTDISIQSKSMERRLICYSRLSLWVVDQDPF